MSSILYQSLIEPSSIELFIGQAMKKKFALIISLIIGISIFVIFMRLVGSPHVIETCIGLVLAIGTGLFVNYKISPWDI